jgi:hypothetical protein
MLTERAVGSCDSMEYLWKSVCHFLNSAYYFKEFLRSLFDEVHRTVGTSQAADAICDLCSVLPI